MGWYQRRVHGECKFHGYRSDTPLFWSIRIARIQTATQDAQQRIQEGKEVRLKHLLPVLPEADPGVQGGLRHHRQRQGWYHHCPGPINFTQMVTLFAEKMSGGTDDDDVIVRSFEA